jgi:hypothetical protein
LNYDSTRVQSRAPPAAALPLFRSSFWSFLRLELNRRPPQTPNLKDRRYRHGTVTVSGAFQFASESSSSSSFRVRVLIRQWRRLDAAAGPAWRRGHCGRGDSEAAAARGPVTSLLDFFTSNSFRTPVNFLQQYVIRLRIPQTDTFRVIHDHGVIMIIILPCHGPQSSCSQ